MTYTDDEIRAAARRLADEIGGDPLTLEAEIRDELHRRDVAAAVDRMIEAGRSAPPVIGTGWTLNHAVNA